MTASVVTVGGRGRTVVWARLRDRAVALCPPATPDETITARAILADRIERSVAFVVPLAGFFAAAWILVVDHESQLGDAVSRMANGYYVFFGRDPHLAAIGFVWQPLTSVASWPLFALKGLFPDLTRLGLGANVMTSVCMAGACYQLMRFFQDLRLGRTTRWLLLAAFVLNPIVFYYGANGMSEAPFLLCLIATTRCLARWLTNGGTRPLLVSAIWLGLAYGVRNEAGMAAAVGVVVVFCVSYARAEGDPRARRNAGLTDAALFVAPFALVFVGWALTSYVIVGTFFAQFSSVYGNASQRVAQQVGQVKQTHGEALRQAVAAALWFAPTLPVALPLAAARVFRDRDIRLLAVLAVPGGVLFFELVTYSLGQLDDLERYFIYAIPLLVMTLAVLARPLDRSRQELIDERAERELGRQPRYLTARRRQRRLLSAGLALVSIALVIPGAFTTDHQMFSSSIGAEDREQLNFIRHPGRTSPYAKQYPALLHDAGYLDSLHTRTGGIMVDDFDGCVPQIILASKDPDEFTIPNDAHWAEYFGVPYQFGIRYMMVSDPNGGNGTENAYAALDALTREYPTLYANGAGMGTLVKQFSIPTCATFRVYRLTPTSAS